MTRLLRDDPQTELLRFQFRTLFGATPPGHFGLACSGGGDSVALLLLAADFAAREGAVLSVATVDHQLRPGAGEEARQVAEICLQLGVQHTTLVWQGSDGEPGWNGQGNLQQAARRARYGLLAAWAKNLDISNVCLGHTADDQAETVLLQMARSAGVDGLAAMAASRENLGVTWLRPLLTVRRSELREFLEGLGQGWIDDPSNDDENFDRIKARKALDALAPLGFSVEKLCALAGNMADARHALRDQTWHFAGDVALVQEGDVLLHRENLMRGHFEIRRRLLAHTLKWVAAAEHGPRARELRNLFSAIQSGRKSTLAGCLITPEGARVRVSREGEAVAGVAAAPSEIWDNRWAVEPLEKSLKSEGYEVRALGENGLRLCDDWRESGLPRTTLLASPAVFKGKALVAAPLAGLSNGWQATLVSGEKDFFNSLVSH